MKYGRYEIVKELGRGAMGVVYQAHDPQIDRLVALKVLRQDRIVSEDFIQRFVKEAKAIGRLSHPNIVTVYDVGQDRDTIYIAMEYLEGRPLDEVIKENNLSFEDIIDIGVQVAESLDYAHKKGIIHRDIKPPNIIFTSDGQVKLTDFGIARIEDTSATMQTKAGEILGTPIYMAPEQVMGHAVDGRSDLYSLGIILYQITVGKRPFEGNNLTSIFRAITQDLPVAPVEINYAISPELSHLIMKSLAKTPDERFQNGKEMAGALRACLKKGDEDVPLQPEKEKSKHVGLVALIASVLLCIAVGLYFFPESDMEEEVVVLSGLQLESLPTGAQVFLDDSLKGKTPLDLDLPVGKYEVRLNLNNYYKWEAQIQLKKDKKTPLFVRLLPIE